METVSTKALWPASASHTQQTHAVWLRMRDGCRGRSLLTWLGGVLLARKELNRLQPAKGAHLRLLNRGETTTEGWVGG